ncbi:MAG TPA: Gfo/Idh/MocA family oxidoreductase [Pyrinomonadaceae bacterium]|jgi:predicted dehydrogenase|nr:Gfo/Idh/MocA family oxidoreductase [Pyrinomonadaceae bacterium]
MGMIRWGMIGCGDVTEVKSGPGFQKAEHSSLVAVMRRDGMLAKDYAERHGVPRWYDDAAKLIDDPEVDAVYIATPPSSHKQYTLMAASTGKPVYVEKPMALNFAECQEMIAACKTAGVPLFVAYYRRALPRFLKIKELIDSEAIGQVRFVSATLYEPPSKANLNAAAPAWRVVPEISGGGLFVDLASHTLNFLDYVFGPILSVQGCAANQDGRYQAEDIVTGLFQFESGVQGLGVWCFTAPEKSDDVRIVGSRGEISFSTFADRPILLKTAAGQTEFCVSNPPHIQQPLIQTIVDELRGFGSCPSHGDTAARTSWVMDQMLSRSGSSQATISSTLS